MSYHAFGGPEFLSEAVARNRAAMCPMPGCGRKGQEVAPAVITYHPDNGVARARLDARLYQCPACGIQFAVSIPE